MEIGIDTTKAGLDEKIIDDPAGSPRFLIIKKY